MDEQNTKQEPIQAEVVNETNNTNTTTQKTDEPAPAGLKVLSFFIPLAGLILFCVNYSDKPRYAKGCGICALIGFFVIPIVTVLIFMLFFVGLGLAIFSTAQNVGITQENTMANSLEIREAQVFNSSFELYEGSQTGSSIRSLMTAVNNSNGLYEDHQVTVKLDGKKKTPSEVRTAVKAGTYYRVRFVQDHSSYIHEIQITAIP